MRARLSSYFDEFGLGPVPEPKEPFPPFEEEQLALVLELRPRVVSFHFGLPDASAVRRVKEAGCLIFSSATTVAEARWLEANGADAIIAQGFEAGGHRGSFSDSPGAGMVGTMALVPQIVDAVRLPVIAAGGIADGRGLAAAFALGASGAQLGTAFLGCPEATVSPLYRAQLRSAVDDGTELTRAFTGRPARALRNRFITEMADSEPLGFPLQASLVGPLWQLPNEEARAAFMPFWAGQAAAVDQGDAGRAVGRKARSGRRGRSSRCADNPHRTSIEATRDESIASVGAGQLPQFRATYAFIGGAACGRAGRSRTSASVVCVKSSYQ